MKIFISICLVLIMATSVTVPLLVQWQGDDVCEIKENKSADDADDTFKIGKEKEVYVLNSHFSFKFDAFSSELSRKTLYFKHDALISEKHTFLPELPPEA